jgi:hypothetical protein
VRHLALTRGRHISSVDGQARGEIRPAREGLRALWAPDGLAQAVAEHLGRGSLLLGRLPHREARFAGTADMKHPVTPDGRYFVVRGRLWRMSDPSLGEDGRSKLTRELMSARRAVRDAKSSGDQDAMSQARSAVDRAKVALGERGPVWWTDGSPDVNRKMAASTGYADWFRSLPSGRPV